MEAREPFVNARDLFERARDSADKLERYEGTLRKLEAREGLHGAGFEAIRSSGISDPMKPTDARMDHESRIRRSKEQCERDINLACAVLYGRDYSGRDGGLYVLADHALSDILCMHYCQNMKWSEVAYLLNYSRSQCIAKASQAFDLIDAIGFERCIQGRGIAEI